MQSSTISAEVKPVKNRTKQAAIAVQRLGFRIHYCGDFISVEGNKSLWVSIFNVSFKLHRQDAGAGLEESEITYEVPLQETIRIPAQLEGLIEEVLFLEPPVLF